MSKSISVTEAVEMIRNSNGKFLTVDFIKRSDNSLRKMNCRIGVSKGVKGTKKTKKNAGLIVVYDMTNHEFRNINISGLRAVSMNGQKFEVK